MVSWRLRRRYMSCSWQEKLPYEPDKAYGYFLDYLELGKNRNIKKLYEFLGKEISYSVLITYNKKYKWVERAEDYDQQQNTKKQKLLEEEVETYFEKRRKALDGYDEIIDSLVASIVSGIMDGDIDPLQATNSIRTLSDSMINVGKYHLRLLGEPSEINDVVKMEQDVKVENENEEVDLLGNDFMNNQLDVLRKLIED